MGSAKSMKWNSFRKIFIFASAKNAYLWCRRIKDPTIWLVDADINFATFAVQFGIRAIMEIMAKKVILFQLQILFLLIITVANASRYLGSLVLVF
jgi:hypothetical protein